MKWLAPSFLAAGCALLISLVATSPASANELLLSKDAIAKVLRHGPWPMPAKVDASNRVSGKAAAIDLGRALFFEKRLSSSGTVACSSCHQPERGWTDGKARAGGLARLDRNTQSLFNVRYNRWFGWDGRNDSLWGHSLGPILDKREMGMTAEAVAAFILGDQAYTQQYETVFQRAASEASAADLLVDLAKAMAAFQETLVSGQTEFDAFRNALARGDLKSAARYPKPAQRGLDIFVGRGKCHFCHSGPLFTNGEFANAGMRYFIGPGKVDEGRFGGINKVRASPFNLLGRYNDDPKRTAAWATRQVKQTHNTFGEFKVPSLRNLLKTAPYMHDGSLATLEDVVKHYSNIDLERLHSD
ncbi:MAG: cytochrome c peroxidase, partial [Pseudomonadota bacterium]